MQITSPFSTMHACRETETQDRARVGGMYDRNSQIPLRLCAAQHSKTSPPSLVTSGVRLPSCRCTGLWEPLGTKAAALRRRGLSQCQPSKYQTGTINPHQPEISRRASFLVCGNP
ncbi:hypothetical protein CGCSCA4_v010342 [Colletotrichum siamense]|uniref:Uncharacterized protein n=1 Tax=Colletotrichum siamense TaxID=690259 RepID=A0A9P5BP37_COLSI|nr:hypothetical protein CGCSCA5_v008876 [Colletotrichum siamense]KAF4840243.1 hypothetical protein CGCSCA4_v010342 [Colletotrichum siamense]KAF4841235.1 hypothetical protein CGCSCA2_v014911 [Colletotrichum siamense]